MLQNVYKYGNERGILKKVVILYNNHCRILYFFLPGFNKVEVSGNHWDLMCWGQKHACNSLRI